MKSFELEFEGTPEQVAEQIFRKIIAPVHGELSKNHSIIADQFALCICGNAIGCFLSSCTLPPKATADLLIRMINEMANGIESTAAFQTATEVVS
ncbi:hypothetical protein [Acinetobacter sp. WCHAc010052]|uniref:hypothetical protein n=1 Tax=Acinetobacter sp. WCHAc010052 TaxID=2004647 RepID=UPI000B3D4258|nr:hypothetical protein [Acinetobacter sp. WCHAc010052]AXY59994.1 hypothetical protein CDG61_08135 [Acinetobacter sp. WCHAc010052]